LSERRISVSPEIRQPGPPLSDPAIAVLPYGLAPGPSLASLPVSELIWPLGCPDRLRGATVGDLRRDDHLIVAPRTATHFRLRRGTKANISLILGEPAVVHAKHLALLRVSYWRFFRVLTFNETLLGRIPNAVFFPLGTTWVPEWRDLALKKSKMISLIASAKRDTQGHKLRHAVVDWARQNALDLEVLGRGYVPFGHKAEGLAPYRFSVVIENARETNYFSEKLVDAVLCDTVPIYWGCPNLERFFDPSGIIQCASLDDVRRAVLAVSGADYQARLPRIQAIRPVLAGYCNLAERAALALRNSL
jgi:Glycosyltransferase family 10 (fucosyltransferase) C-term